MTKRTKLSSLEFRVLGKIKRDKNYPHQVVLHDIFGRPVLRIPVSAVYDGRGERFEDDIPR